MTLHPEHDHVTPARRTSRHAQTSSDRTKIRDARSPTGRFAKSPGGSNRHWEEAVPRTRRSTSIGCTRFSHTYSAAWLKSSCRRVRVVANVRPSGRGAHFIRLCAEPLHRPPDALLRVDPGLPAENFDRPADLWASAARVTLRQFLMADWRPTSSYAADQFGQFQDAELPGIAKIKRTWVRRVEHGNYTANEIIDITEASGLFSGSIDCQLFTVKVPEL